MRVVRITGVWRAVGKCDTIIAPNDVVDVTIRTHVIRVVSVLGARRESIRRNILPYIHINLYLHMETPTVYYHNHLLSPERELLFSVGIFHIIVIVDVSTRIDQTRDVIIGDNHRRAVGI